MLDYVARLLFEELHLLLLTEAVALAVVLAIHRRRLTRQSRRLVLVTLGVCALLIVIQKLTITRRESLEQMVAALAQAVDDGDIPSITKRLDHEFQYGSQPRPWDKKAFLTKVSEKLQRWEIDQASVRGFDIEMRKKDEASVSFRATCDWRSGSRVEHDVLSRWRLYCVYRPDGWKVFRIEEGKIGPGAMLDFGDVWRY